MSKIIQPLGPIVHQILIELDAKGVAKVTAENIVFTKRVPMHPLQMSAVLAQVVSQTLQVLASPQRGNANAEQEAKNNHD